MIEYIKNERGAVIGTAETHGTLITYNCYGVGVVGEYDTQKRQYHRWKCKPGQTPFPMNNIDYGVQDIMLWTDKR